jgi:transposase
MTIIGDRESDIYEEFLQVPDDRTDVLVRAKANRRLVGEDEKLFEYIISEQSVRMSFPLDVFGKNKRAKRTAKMEFRFANVTIDAPKKNKGKKKQIKLTVIEVRESSRTVLEKEKAILWRLITTHEIKTIDQAMQCVEWYKKRWLIEELFRVLKTKGFRIESSQLSSGEGLKKLLALTLEAAVKVMALKLSLTQDIKRVC